MPAVDKLDDLGILDHGPAVIVAMGLFGKRSQHVGRGHAAGQCQQPLRDGACRAKFRCDGGKKTENRRFAH